MPAKSTSRRKPAAEETPPAAADAPAGNAASRPGVRRVSKKIATRKTPADTPPASDPSSSAAFPREVTIEVVHEHTAPARPDAVAPQEAAERHEPTPGDSGWPEPETVGAGEQDGGFKRKRRRRKGKGKGQPQGGPPGDEPPPPPAGPVDGGQSAAPGENPPLARPAAHQPRVRLDSELLAKFAWKIYLAEVSEEGIALINDREAREVSRRCFRLAEIFLEEQSRQAAGR